jgi:hypothetical protein
MEFITSAPFDPRTLPGYFSPVPAEESSSGVKRYNYVNGNGEILGYKLKYHSEIYDCTYERYFIAAPELKPITRDELTSRLVDLKVNYTMNVFLRESGIQVGRSLSANGAFESEFYQVLRDGSEVKLSFTEFAALWRIDSCQYSFELRNQRGGIIALSYLGMYSAVEGIITLSCLGMYSAVEGIL